MDFSRPSVDFIAPCKQRWWGYFKIPETSDAVKSTKSANYSQVLVFVHLNSQTHELNKDLRHEEILQQNFRQIPYSWQALTSANSTCVCVLFHEFVFSSHTDISKRLFRKYYQISNATFCCYSQFVLLQRSAL